MTSFGIAIPFIPFHSVRRYHNINFTLDGYLVFGTVIDNTGTNGLAPDFWWAHVHISIRSVYLGMELWGLKEAYVQL
jgi:hypothetical protein